MRRELTVEDHVQGVLGGDRAILGRTITLVESNRAEHHDKAQRVLAALLPHAGGSHRVGVSGVPGVGKSTFLESMGVHLLDAGHRVAVLAIDPSSTVTGGSILGDKTRMAKVASDPRAFVRPSPTGGSLGGVHRKTRESMRVVEAAGFDVVFVETVGVGQSEIEVAEMVDTFLVLMLSGAGDELQGIKKGILEVADVLAVNKADGDNALKAERASRELKGALHFVTPRSPHWTVPVTTCSGLTGLGLEGVWASVQAHRTTMQAHGAFEGRRKDQRLRWMWAMAQQEVLRQFREHPGVEAIVAEVTAGVRDDALPVSAAVARMLAAWRP